jgi:hypothetical protein
MELAFINRFTLAVFPGDPGSLVIPFLIITLVMLVAMLSRLTGVISGGIVQPDDLAGICADRGAYGIMNCRLLGGLTPAGSRQKGCSRKLGLYWPFVYPVVSNLEGGFEILHARGCSGKFWARQTVHSGHGWI